MRLAPLKDARRPAYPGRLAHRRPGSQLGRWCRKTVVAGAAVLSLSLLSACVETDEVRLAGGVAPTDLDIWLYDSVLPPERKPPQPAPSSVRDPRKPPPPGGPGHRHLPPPRRTRS